MQYAIYWNGIDRYELKDNGVEIETFDSRTEAVEAADFLSGCEWSDRYQLTYDIEVL